jgi:hypothetical protein
MDRFRNLQIICFALTMSVVLVNLLLAFLFFSGSLQPSGVPKPVAVTVFAVALTLLVASPAVKGAVFKRADAEGFDGDPNRRFAAYQAAYIAAFAMREAGALLGFILALMTGNTWWSWGLGAAALIAMINDWPKPEALGWDQIPGPK